MLVRFLSGKEGVQKHQRDFSDLSEEFKNETPEPFEVPALP
jgi:hypothetical protein